MSIFGWRSDTVDNLVEPGQELRFGELVSWPEGTTGEPADIIINLYRVESLEWDCISEIEQGWMYTNNFFRPFQTNLNSVYVNQDSLACRLYEAEPLFSIEPGEAVALIEEALDDFPTDGPGRERARMILAMFYALDGRPFSALDLVSELQVDARPGSWLANQTDAFMRTIGLSSATPLDICEELIIAGDYPACNIDGVLERLFADQSLSTGEPLLDQLEAMGLPVLESMQVTEVGRRDRIAVNFARAGTSWWAFVPLPDGFYEAGIFETPEGFGEAVFPLGLLDAPQSAYDALLLFDDATGALSVLENTVFNNPDRALSPAARYLQALSYDLLADRTRARDAYYQLWADYTSSVWGQLAGAHLERRGE